MSKANQGTTSYYTTSGPTAGNWRFGGTGSAWDGDIGEIIVFNRALNTAERAVMENHLQAKYNTGVLEAATDYYDGDTPANGNYDSGVIGVGRYNAANIVAAAGNDGFGIEAVSGLDDGEFVMAGHKVADGANGVAPIGNNITGDRIVREWYISATDNANIDLQLAFNLNDMGLSASTNAAFFLLQKDAENDPFAMLLGAPSGFSGDTILFDVNSNLIDGSILALGMVNTPEPTTLVLWSTVGGIGLAFALRRRLAKR